MDTRAPVVTDPFAVRPGPVAAFPDGEVSLFQAWGYVSCVPVLALYPRPLI